MKRRLLFLVGMVAAIMPALCQDPTATDPNEGSRLIQTSATTFSFKWWGKTGTSYFIQQADDLLSPWYYLPVVGTGGNGIFSLGINAPSNDKLFLRLEPLLYDPYTTDSDGDGMADAYEVLNYLNPKVADGTLDLDGDGIPNREDARPKNPAIGRLSISITSPGNGNAIP